MVGILIKPRVLQSCSQFQSMAGEAPSKLAIEVEGEAQIAAENEIYKEVEDGGSKRAREEEDSEQNGDKRAKLEGGESGEEAEKLVDEAAEEKDGASVGPKTFRASVEMFDYFYKLLHTWPTNLNLNKYEHIVVLELLKKGHLESERKIAKGVKAFQVRFHPQFENRCFFLINEDESVDDFSFRKCVDHILPLPDNMLIKHDGNKALRGKGGNRGRGPGRGQGRGRGRGRRR